MKILIIQTAFIGDVILATPVLETLRRAHTDAHIDVLVRAGCERLFEGHPSVGRVWVWRKKGRKYANLLRLIGELRRERYDWAINCQRFAASGLLTVSCGARHTAGFDKNPFSLFFSKKIAHRIGQGHETERNLSLVAHLAPDSARFARPCLYPQAKHIAELGEWEQGAYVTMAPASVWPTKQWPEHKWVELMRLIPPDYRIALIGGPEDRDLCARILEAGGRGRGENLAGRLSLLASAALMSRAAMCYVNDSAPLHLASAVNAPVCAVFCSTLPEFGFGPLSDRSFVLQTEERLPCRPCGLHGKYACPKGHFACAEGIDPARAPLPGA